MIALELRRSQAPWTAALITGLGAVMYYAGANLSGGWARLAMEHRAMLGVLWALACGLGAGQARRERKRRMEELLATTALPRHRRVLPTAAATAFAAVAGYVGLFTAGAVHVVSGARYFPVGVIPTVLIGALSMVAAVWLGLAIGGWLPSPLTPPLAVVAGVTGLFVVPSYVLGVRFGAEPPGSFLLSPVLQITNGMKVEFVTLTAKAQLAQLVWLTAVAVSALVLFAANSLRARVAAIPPMLAGLTVALALVPPQMAGAFVVDRGAVEPVCTPEPPTVCVTHVHSDRLGEVREPVGQALSILAAKLASDAPVVAQEDYENPLQDNLVPQRADTVLFSMTDAPPAQLVWQVLSGAGTRPCLTLHNKQTATARLVAAAWLLDAEPTPDLDKFADVVVARQLLQRIRSLPPGEQQARILALRRAELTCAAGNRLEMLAG